MNFTMKVSANMGFTKILDTILKHFRDNKNISLEKDCRCLFVEPFLDPFVNTATVFILSFEPM